jgi:hypothetical protein
MTFECKDCDETLAEKKSPTLDFITIKWKKAEKWSHKSYIQINLPY